MKINLFLALLIYITSYALFILCFMYEHTKTKEKYKKKLKFMHNLACLQSKELKELKLKLKDVENAKKENAVSKPCNVFSPSVSHMESTGK